MVKKIDITDQYCKLIGVILKRYMGWIFAQTTDANKASKTRQTGFKKNEMMLGRDGIQQLDIFLGTADKR